MFLNGLFAWFECKAEDPAQRRPKAQSIFPTISRRGILKNLEQKSDGLQLCVRLFEVQGGGTMYCHLEGKVIKPPPKKVRRVHLPRRGQITAHPQGPRRSRQ